MVIFDLETTGFSPTRDRIVEIGAIKVRDNAIVDQFNHLVNPECHIPSVATSVHHITDEMVEREGTIEQILPGFLEFIDQDTLVAHNASFDMGFVNGWAEKLELPKPQNPVICTLQLSRKVFPSLRSHKLGELVSQFDILTKIQHRALADVETTWRIYKILAAKQSLGLDDELQMGAQRKPRLSNPKLSIEKQPDGSYKAGKKHGKWVYYYSGGQVMSEGCYKHGVIDGKWIYYYENGGTKRVEAYEDGKASESWAWYDENGKVIGRGS